MLHCKGKARKLIYSTRLWIIINYIIISSGDNDYGVIQEQHPLSSLPCIYADINSNDRQLK